MALPCKESAVGNIIGSLKCMLLQSSNIRFESIRIGLHKAYKNVQKPPHFSITGIFVGCLSSTLLSYCYQGYQPNPSADSYLNEKAVMFTW